MSVEAALSEPISTVAELAPVATVPFDPLGLLIRGRRRLLLIALVGLVAGGVHALLAPRWYEGHVTLVPVGSARLAVGTASDPDDQTGAVGSLIERLADTLRGDAVGDAVLAAVPLGGEAEIAREKLWKRCSVTTRRRSGFVVVTCEDRSPQRVHDLLAQFISAGNETLRRVSGSSASDERRFLEARVASARADMESAGRQLQDFQVKNQVIDLGEQAKASLSAIAALEGERLTQQMQLEYLDRFTSRDESTRVQLRRRIAALDEKLQTYEGGRPADDPRHSRPTVGSLPAVAKVPALRYENERLFREQRVQETLYVLLLRMLEVAKVNEARDTSAFQILDPPRIPVHPSRPKKPMVIGIDLAVAVALALALILGPASWRAWVRRGDELEPTGSR